MSGSASITLEQAILGHTLGFAQMALPSSVWVALCSASLPPSETVRGIEASGGGYTRMRATFALIDTPANIAANTTSVEWPVATASWGTLGFFELWDAPTGGNRLYWGPFSPATPVTAAPGDIVRFSAGNLAVQASSGTGGTTSIGAYLPLAGGSMSGPLLLSADPTTYLQAATKQYVDAHSGTGGGPGFLPLSGGTMLGTLSLAGNATLPLHAVPLQQVDTLNVVNVLNHGAKGDGTTDDTAAIQAVLNTYAGKATVFVPDTGHPFMVGPLFPPSFTDLLIYGTLMLRPGAAQSLIEIQSVNNVTIRGYGVLDGNTAAQDGSHIIATLETVGSNNIRIRDVVLQNAAYWNLNVVQSSSVVVEGVTIRGGRNAPEFAAESDDCWLMNSLLDGPTLDIGFAFYGGVTNSGAIGNVFRNAGPSGGVTAVGVNVLSDDGQPAACRNIVISGNLIYNASGSGIAVTAAAPGAVHSAIIISNNRCYNNGRSGFGNRGDIDINGATDVLVIGNQSDTFGSNTGGRTDPWYGLAVWDNCSGVSLVGNMVSSVGQGGTAGVGLYIHNASGVLASANYLLDNQPTHTMTASIGGSAGAQNAFTGNYCMPPVTIAVLADTVVSHAIAGQFQFGANNSTYNMHVSITGGAGTFRGLEFGTNSLARWYMGAEASAESGGNAGSNFQIASVNDAGNVFLPTPFSISRATGRVTLAVAPTITTLPTNAANDAAAAAAGVSVGGVYRNGSALMVRAV